MTRPLIYTDAIGAHASHCPGKPALIDSAGTITYGQLRASASSITVSLARLGIGRGDMVAVAMPPSAAQAVTVVGVMAAGAVVCPLNIRLAPPEVADFLGSLGPKLAIVSETFVPLLANVPAPTVHVRDADDHAAVVRAVEAAAAGAPHAGPIRIDETDPIMVVGTGGTTGVPKAATYSHRGLWAWSAICGHIQEMRQDDVHLYLSPFFHSTIVTNLLTAFFLGATVRLLAGYEEDAIVNGLNRDQLTWMYAAPTVLARLLEAPRLQRGRQGRLRVIAFGSMKSQADMPAELRKAFPGIRLITGYGTTEFGPVTRIKGNEIGTDPSCVGRPVAGVRIEIRRGDGTVASAGEEGEIVVWCPWQMVGYWGRPQQTAETLVDGGIRPGDIGRFDAEGRLYLMGRSKDAIITGGENVWPAEVENALAAHPDVLDVVVYGAEDTAWGERIEAALVLRPGASLDLAAVREFGRQLVASYKLPRSIRILDAIPLTPLSKPDRRALKRAAAAAPLPDMAARRS